jgi:hypothetical protein
VTSQPSVDRLRRNFRDQAGGSAAQALVALFIAVVTGGAHVARIGTPQARAAVAGAILGVVLWQVLLSVLAFRRWKSPRLTLRHVLYATDSQTADRAMRALTLVERTESDQVVGSAELASLHLSRLLDRVSNDAVRTVAGRQAQRLRGAAIVLLSCAVLAVFIDPARVVEGLDVLVARGGRAPLTMTWLRYPRISAQPPSYTREGEHTLVLGSSASVPKGTVITIRGIPRVPDRALVVTDGSTAVPFASDGAGGIVARYTARASATLRVAARFGDVRIDDEDSLDITVVPDARPKVELEGAPRTVKLVEAENIVVRWAAHDDHGLREVDLVLRSGAREDRRVLGRFDGESKVERGGQVVSVRDAFLRRIFLPATLTVEAKDNDPFDGPKWSSSAPLTVEPPDVGEPEVARFRGVIAFRDELVALLDWKLGAKNATDAELRKDGADRLAAISSSVDHLIGSNFAGTTLSRGMRSFLDGQVERLRSSRRGLSERAIEDAVLAVDVAIRSLGNRDAADVAKRLGEVAEEAALGARLARETEHKNEGLSRLDVALGAVEKGARNLVVLSSLGKDLGGVATADAGRIRRAREASDLTHAELAALHLAARLGRPTPSFGATTGSGKKGGVESGHGPGREDNGGPSPSSADEEFDRASGALDDLARDHQGALHDVESSLEQASRVEPSEADRQKAKELARKVREAADSLPLPGQEFGTPAAAAALAREQANATAHALENLSLKEAKENADGALESMKQSEQRLDPDDGLRQEFRGLRSALKEATDFANRELERRRAEAEERARGALGQASESERELGDRARRLSSGEGQKESMLPREQAEQLDRAAGLMDEASRELAAGHGERGLELQREAQRLLEKSRVGRSREQEEQAPHDPKSQTDEDGTRRDGRDSIALGGDVPPPDERARAEEFRRRVLMGLARERSERLSPAVKRYTEGLLK